MDQLIDSLGYTYRVFKFLYDPIYGTYNQLNIELFINGCVHWNAEIEGSFKGTFNEPI